MQFFDVSSCMYSDWPKTPPVSRASQMGKNGKRDEYGTVLKRAQLGKCVDAGHCSQVVTKNNNATKTAQ